MVLGSPTYFAAVSADLKALIERAGYVAIANNHAFSGKIGAAVVAVRRGGATHAYDAINHMFQLSKLSKIIFIILLVLFVVAYIFRQLSWSSP